MYNFATASIWVCVSWVTKDMGSLIMVIQNDIGPFLLSRELCEEMVGV